MKQVILLRGINVGRHGKLPMKDLCQMLETLGAKNPRSYIQSGNVVIENSVDAAALANLIESEKGFLPKVMVISGDEFRVITQQIPFEEPDGKLLHIWFASSNFTFDQEKADTLIEASEALYIAANAVMLHAPLGIGRSKLAAKMEKLMGVAATARNMNTVNKLLEMLDG